MDRHSFRRAASWLVQSSEWLLLLALVAITTLPFFLLRRHSLIIVPFFNWLDGSWLVDACYKAAGGIWFGRDVAFTYRPLYQWLASAPSRWLGISAGSILGTAPILPTLVVILATFAGARLLMPEVAPWRRALLLLLALLFWSPPNIRNSLCVLAFLLFLRITHFVAAEARGFVLHGALAAVIAYLCFLISADAGLYAVAGLVLSTAATAMATSTISGARARLAGFFVSAAVVVAILVVATNAVMFSPLDFTYWKSSLIIAGGYRWFEPYAMPASSKHWIIGMLGFAIVVFAVAGWQRASRRKRWTLDPAFLIAGFGMAFVMMQSALVRSDAPHMLNGLYPMIFLCGAILIAEDRSHWKSAVLLLVVASGTAALVRSYSKLLPSDAFRAKEGMFRPVHACPAGYREFDLACFGPDTAEALNTVSAYVVQHTRPGDSIAVFPYENVFGASSRRTVAGGVLQAYLATGDYLANLDIAGLDRTRPPLGLYFPDGAISAVLDGVPSFTRSPELWFYLLRHYRSDVSPRPGVLGLAREDTRGQRLILAEQQIAASPGRVAVGRRSTTVDLGQLQWPASGADFLKLHFRADYSLLWKVCKPSALSLQMSFADGSQKTVQFLAEPNRDTEVWVYPWEEKDMGSYFSGDDAQWRSGNRPAIVGLRVWVTPFDWISVTPRAVTISNVSAVSVSLAK